MIKNNVFSLIYQGILSLLFFLLIWFTKDNEIFLRFLFGTFAGKILIGLLVLALYQVLGRLLWTRGLVDIFTSSLALVLLEEPAWSWPIPAWRGKILPWSRPKACETYPTPWLPCPI